MDTWNELKKRWKSPRRVWVYLRWRRKHARYYRHINAYDAIRINRARIERRLAYRELVKHEMEMRRADTLG